MHSLVSSAWTMEEGNRIMTKPQTGKFVKSHKFTKVNLWIPNEFKFVPQNVLVKIHNTCRT